MGGLLLPHLDESQILSVYRAAPGNELASGKFASPESSAALVANGFGLFLSAPHLLPPFLGVDAQWPPISVTLEGIARFPWSGGRHPCLDVLVETPNLVLGIESKRYEPFRTKGAPSLSPAYWRPVWGDHMRGFERVRDGLRDDELRFDHLDAAQLVKHALGLRTLANRVGKRAALIYLQCDPKTWPDGRPVPEVTHLRHRQEVADFAAVVAGDEVAFHRLTWSGILSTWASSEGDLVRHHAEAMRQRFAV